MVSLLFFYSNDPSSNPGEVYQFSVVWVLKINKKRLVMDHFLKKYSNFARLFAESNLRQLSSQTTSKLKRIQEHSTGIIEAGTHKIILKLFAFIFFSSSNETRVCTIA